MRSPEAGPSSCRSLGSNQYNSGRFSKVSIGIAVDKFSRLDSGANNEYATSLLTSEKRYAFREKIIQEESLEPANIESNRCKATAKFQRISEKLSTNLFRNGTETTDTGHEIAQKQPVSHLEVNGNELTVPKGEQSGKAQKPSTINSIKSMISEALNQETVHVVANQTPSTGKQVSSHKKIVSDMELKKGAYADNHDITTEEEVHAPAKSITREQSDRVTKSKSETLRMKLWEILGTSSQNKQPICSPDHKTPSSSFENEGGEVEKRRVTKAKHNSDTIETDSESPDQTVRRPVTRSIKKEKAPAKYNKKMLPASSKRKIPLASSSSASKLKLENRNIFTFVEEDSKAVKSDQVCNGLTNSFPGKRSKQRKARIEPRRIKFSRNSTSEKGFQTAWKEETSALHNKATSKSHGAESSPLASQLEKTNLVTPAQNEVSNVNHYPQKEVKVFHHTPVASNQECHKLSGSFGRKSLPSDQSKSQAQKKCGVPKEVDTPPVAKSATPSIDFESPTFAFNTTKRSRESKLRDEVISPMVSQKRTSTSRAYISKFVEDYTSTRQNEDAYIKSSEETRDIHGLLDASPHVVEEKGTERCASFFSKEQEKSEGFEANEFLNRGFASPENCSYDDGSLNESPFISLTTKIVHNPKDDTISQINISTSPLDCSVRTEETTLDQFPEDSLTRAVYQLAIFLQKFKNKMKSRTSKKSCEIVLAASEQVHMQIQGVKSKIDEDLGRFISFGKSKRRRLESKFQEQGEMLRAMHDKFKEELNKHLLDCSSTLEEIETQNKELKGYVERQKASHQKFLLQVKEAIENQLSESDRKIAALHEEANRKMNILKRAFREWMVEDTA